MFNDKEQYKQLFVDLEKTLGWRVNVFRKISDVLFSQYKKSMAHGLEHIYIVTHIAVHIYKNYLNMAERRSIDKESLLYAVYLHDICSKKDRKNHHTLAAKWVRETTHPAICKLRDKEQIAQAIEEHRSSYTGEYSSLLSQVLATADRMPPSINLVLGRMLQHRVENGNTNDPKAVINSMIKHIKEKYDPAEGYINYPPLYRSIYGEMIAEFEEDIRDILSGDAEIILGAYVNKDGIVSYEDAFLGDSDFMG